MIADRAINIEKGNTMYNDVAVVVLVDAVAIDAVGRSHTVSRREAVELKFTRNVLEAIT